VDIALASVADVPRNAARRLCEAGRVALDGKRAKAGDRVRAHAVLALGGGGDWLVPVHTPVVPVLWQGPGLVVVHKPAGIPCHPLVPGEGGTVVDHVVAQFPEIATASPHAREAGLVHRLDTDTSGCLAIARDRATHARVRALFDDGTVNKRYLALVHGAVTAPLTVDAPIAHDPADPRRMLCGPDVAGGKSARTHAVPLHARGAHTLVEVDADRGRRHQVRVHLAHAGHPLVGDVLYGGTGEGGHALHAWTLAIPGFPAVTAPPPPTLNPGRAHATDGANS
jgi:23S rRNA pseudouridine1911/1915/1917 synthase